MTDDEIKKAVKAGLQEFLLVLGMDVSTPAEIKEVQKDIAHLRTLRLAGLAFTNKLLLGGASAIGAGLVGYFFAHWHFS